MIAQNYVKICVRRGGGVHLPIARALRLPELQPKKNNLWAVSLRFAPVLWPLSDLDVEKYVEGKKKKE